MRSRIVLEGLALECIIGIFDWERVNKQLVNIDLTLDVESAAGMTDDIHDAVDYKSLARDIKLMVEPSQFMLIEKMAEEIAAMCLGKNGVRSVTVKVSKPGALRGARNVAVEVTRPELGVTIHLGLGSNIEPEANIRKGLELLKSRFLVTAISPMYRSPAWGVSDSQPDYVNLAVSAVTDYDLFSTRAELRFIEELTGRRRHENKFAPRTLDIDLLLYGDITVNDEWGQIPHPHLLTKRFVYKPMMDIAAKTVIPGRGVPLETIAPVFDDSAGEIVKV